MWSALGFQILLLNIQRKKSSRYEKHTAMPLWSDISLS